MEIPDKTVEDAVCKATNEDHTINPYILSYEITAYVLEEAAKTCLGLIGNHDRHGNHLGAATAEDCAQAIREM